MNSIFADLPTTIFEVMSGLARDKRAINLGQGFPDDPGPEDVRRKAAEATLKGPNQYPSMMGTPDLRAAIGEHYARFQGLDLDPERETLVTSGATEALAGAIFALIEPGDEVVLFQPMYDAYLPLVLRAGGVPKFITLRPPHWTILEDDLRGAFGPRTRAVIFNNPLNPCGIVYERQQLELLASFCQRWDVVAICDEVWEHVVFDGRSHISMMAIAGMRDRTVKIGSAGKIFSLTGWKVGLVAAAPPLLQNLAKAHQFLTFTTPPNLQTGRIRSKQGRKLFRRHAALLSAKPRPTYERFDRAGIFGIAKPGNVFSYRRRRAIGRKRRRELLHAPRYGIRRRRDSDLGLLCA